MSPDIPRDSRTGARTAVSRRAFGTGVVGVAASTALLTAGCDPDVGIDLPGLPTIGSEPDHDRVVAGLRDEQAVLDAVARVRRRHRTLRSDLAATEAVHQSHVDLLGKAVDDGEKGQGTDGSEGSDAGSPGDRVPGNPAQAVAELIRLERGLAARHVATAMKSRSGTLARAVAAMSAAAAQQAVVLAPLAVDGPERDG